MVGFGWCYVDIFVEGERAMQAEPGNDSRLHQYTRATVLLPGNYRGRRPVRGKMSYVLPSCKMYASAFLAPLCSPRKLATVSCTP